MEFEYQELLNDENSFAKSQAILNAAFLDRDIVYSKEFLHWQYEKNPVGPVVGFNAIAPDGTVAAHYATIPVEAHLFGRIERGTLTLNLATHPDYRGKGLFVSLAKRTHALAQTQGFSFVIAVANANSTPGFVKKLGFQLVSPLTVKLGLGPRPKRWLVNKQLDFSTVGNSEFLSWRLSKPNSNYRVDSLGGSIIGDSPIRLVNIILRDKGLGDVNLPGSLRKQRWPSNCFPSLWIGLDPERSWSRATYFNFPEKLKPSPLNFIFKDLTSAGRSLTRENVYFDALDFDAF